MTAVEIRDMEKVDEYFIGTCTHEDESDEMDACGWRRTAWLRVMFEEGVRVKVAHTNGERVGFLYAMPIEIAPWGPIGSDLLVVPCLYVKKEAEGEGVGEALMKEAEEEARRQGKKGVATIGYHGDFWFMPAGFFEKCGYTVAAREEDTAIMWKTFDQSAKPPRFLTPAYVYKPVPGKVVVDLFWHPFCATVDIEAQRVREVAEEFGDQVILNDYCTEDRETLLECQTARAIFVNGKEIGWGHEAPRDGIREAIDKALREL